MVLDAIIQAQQSEQNPQQIEAVKNALWLSIMQSNPIEYVDKNEQIVQFFKQPKIIIDPNIALTFLGLTALHQASSNGNLNLVQFLVAIMKTNIDQQDSQGRTALHYACSIGNQAIVEYLIQSKASVNIQTHGGDTAVMKAAQFHQSNLLIYLIEAHGDKINWNLENNSGLTVIQIYYQIGVNSIDRMNVSLTNIVDFKAQLHKDIKETHCG